MKRAADYLSERRLNMLKANMGYLSEMGMWQRRIEKDVDSEWRGLLADVLTCITRELADMDIITASQSGQQAHEIVAQLDQEELEEWKIAVRKGVENGDWTDLIEHPRLKELFQTRESLGVPID